MEQGRGVSNEGVLGEGVSSVKRACTFRIADLVPIRHCGGIALLVLAGCCCQPASVFAQELVEVVEVAAEDAEAVDVEMDEVEFQELALPADPQTQKVQTHLAVQRAFVSRVCKLDDEQKKKLKSMDNDWLDKVIKEKDEPKAQNQPGLIGLFFGVQRQPVRPQRVNTVAMRKRVDTKIKALLSEEQRKAYDEAYKDRVDFRNRTRADAMIESLQSRLDLSDEQRQKIRKKIMPWVAENDVQIQHYFNGNNYYPDIPIHLLSDLTDEQRNAYQGLQRHLWTAENFHDGNMPIAIKE